MASLYDPQVREAILAYLDASAFPLSERATGEIAETRDRCDELIKRFLGFKALVGR